MRHEKYLAKKAGLEPLEEALEKYKTECSPGQLDFIIDSAYRAGAEYREHNPRTTGRNKYCTECGKFYFIPDLPPQKKTHKCGQDNE